MLKKIALMAGLLVTGFASQAHAVLSLLGNGGCRLAVGGQGTFSTHPNVSWQTCRSLCLNQPTCRAVEYAIKRSGATNCEVHTKAISSVASNDLSLNSSASCWLNIP
jgi:hypothetical protein